MYSRSFAAKGAAQEDKPLIRISPLKCGSISTSQV
jgi:hypothetical protein